LVVSREISYDGSTRQILHLIENGVVSEIPDKPKISPPPTISLNGSQLSIIDNSGIAEEYVIIADGIEKQSVYSASVDLLSIGLFVGTHLISVKARANGFTDSARSNEVTFIIKSSQYEKISFKIGEDIYFAEETMTWYDWCHSGYNTGGWIARANDQYNEIFRYVSSSKIETIVANGTSEKAINAIVGDYAYSVKEGFVDNTDNSELLDYVDKNYASKKELADAKAELEQSIDDAIGDIDFS
jgi:hypothetical protein